MSLLAVFHDGRALIARSILTIEAFALLPGDTRERNVSWLDRSQALSLSSDGQKILYGKIGEGQGTVYLGRGDGSPAVPLGEGRGAFALSPDGKWALTTQGSPRQVVLLPTGAGQAVRLPRGDVEFEGRTWFFWFPDGKRILFNGHGPDGQKRCYVQSTEGGGPRALPLSGVGCRAPSPDGKFVLTSKGELY
ncbi:MAG TPA: hypothetical protein VGK70_07285, partial [Thermoanaerobaculia bacterium]